MTTDQKVSGLNPDAVTKKGLKRMRPFLIPALKEFFAYKYRVKTNIPPLNFGLQILNQK